MTKKWVIPGLVLAVATAASANDRATAPDDGDIRLAQGGTYQYTADLEKDALHQGSVVANGASWRCINKQCTVSHSRPDLGVRTCAALAEQVGAIKRYGRPGFRLGSRDLDQCNLRAARETQGSGVTFGGGHAGRDITPVEVDLPGGGEGGETADLPATIGIDRVEVMTRGGVIHLYVRGDNFPTPREGYSVIILPNKGHDCYAECAQGYLEYERQLMQAQQGRWETDVLGVDMYTFRPQPSAEEFFGGLPGMVDSHDVLIRDAAGYQVAHRNVPISEFGFVDTDADGDGHVAVKWHGDDCDDQDPERYQNCEP